MIGCGYTDEEEEPEGGAHPQREREGRVTSDCGGRGKEQQQRGNGERVGLGDDQPPWVGKKESVICVGL